jgi:hypothetical protein
VSALCAGRNCAPIGSVHWSALCTGRHCALDSTVHLSALCTGRGSRPARCGCGFLAPRDPFGGTSLELRGPMLALATRCRRHPLQLLLDPQCCVAQQEHTQHAFQQIKHHDEATTMKAFPDTPRAVVFVLLMIVKHTAPYYPGNSEQVTTIRACRTPATYFRPANHCAIQV